MIKSLNIVQLNDVLNTGILDSYKYVILTFDKIDLKAKLLKRLDRRKVCIIQVTKVDRTIRVQNISKHLHYLLNNANEHGLVILTNKKEMYFSLNKSIDINVFLTKVFAALFVIWPIKRAHKRYDDKCERRFSIVQLSDIHVGKKEIVDNIPILSNMVDSYSKYLDDYRYVVTGDMVNTPSEENNKGYEMIEKHLESLSHKEVITVLGNHDVNSSGLKFLPRKRKKEETYPIIQVDEENKHIYVLLNSNVSGLTTVLARGQIGKEQFAKLESDYNKVKEKYDINLYDTIVLLHHHVVPIKTPAEFKEGIIKRVISSDITMQLGDSNKLLDWLKKENIKYVMHGHKHVPSYTKYEDLHVISCGSSTGADYKFKDGKPCISINVLRANKENPFCLEYYAKSKDESDVTIYMLK